MASDCRTHEDTVVVAYLWKGPARFPDTIPPPPRQYVARRSGSHAKFRRAIHRELAWQRHQREYSAHTGERVDTIALSGPSDIWTSRRASGRVLFPGAG